ncbi:MAG: phage major capsid protein, partial [Chloroflexaceae bacterium]|nr:phage major capsid protein [Chloroflexaceae bacterium]
MNDETEMTPEEMQPIRDALDAFYQELRILVAARIEVYEEVLEQTEDTIKEIRDTEITLINSLYDKTQQKAWDESRIRRDERGRFASLPGTKKRQEVLRNLKRGVSEIKKIMREKRENIEATLDRDYQSRLAGIEGSASNIRGKAKRQQFLDEQLARLNDPEERAITRETLLGEYERQEAAAIYRSTTEFAQIKAQFANDARVEVAELRGDTETAARLKTEGSLQGLVSHRAAIIESNVIEINVLERQMAAFKRDTGRRRSEYRWLEIQKQDLETEMAENQRLLDSAIDMQNGVSRKRKGKKDYDIRETLIYDGGDAVKALGNGRVAGYLVRFGDPDQPDLVGDYFTSETDFGRLSSTDVYYHHGLDRAIKARTIGRGTLRQDEVGVWIEAQLSLADQYEQAIYDMVKAGKLRWSSGTLSHLVEREPTGGATHVKRWMLGLDASLTPTPAEPRGTAASIKALAEVKMDENENEFEPCKACETPEACAEAGECAAKAAQGEAKTAGELAALRAEITAMKAGFVTPDAVSVADHGAAEMKAFNGWLRTGKASIKAPMRVGSDPEGGYLVPRTYSNELIVALKDASILRRAGARVVNISGTKAIEVPSLVHGGAAVLTAENAAFDQKEPTVGVTIFTPYKYTRISRVSEELLGDSRVDVARELLTPDYVQAFAAAENTDFTTGSGSSRPQGVVTGSTLGKTAASATAITFDEVLDLYYKLNYLYRQNAVWL